MSFSLRPVTARDLAAIHALQRRAEAHDGIPVATPLEEFEEWLTDPHLDPALDTRLAEVADRVVGWARIWHRPSGEVEERAFLLGAVDPDHRRRGIGSALLAWQIGRAREILRSATRQLPRYIRTRAYDFEHAAIRLYQRHGMVPVRYGEEMLRGLEAPPPAPSLTRVTVVPWDGSRSEEARIASNQAFADHWGSPPRDRAAWEHELAAFGVRLDLSFLALDEDRVVGVCLNAHFPGDEAVSGRRDGWISRVSVVRSHRKRGIASALIVASLAVFERAGFTHAILGVDSENPTGAYRLYERLGFRSNSRSIIHQLEG